MFAKARDFFGLCFKYSWLWFTSAAGGIPILGQIIPGTCPVLDVFRVRFLDACTVRQMEFPSIDVDCIFLLFNTFLIPLTVRCIRFSASLPALFHPAFTRYLNIEGMLPFENEIADHVHETKHHVLYRVTPIFLGDDLVCRGVEMEAMCIEDNGKTNGSGVCFHVFAYNVQPGIGIDYATGESWVEESGKGRFYRGIQKSK